LDANEPKFVDGKVEIIPEVGEALSALGEAGLFAAGFDEAVGGLQLPWVVTTNINGIFTAANLSVANYAFLTVGAANMLNTFGTDEQKDAYLPNMLAGRWFGTMCLSEPQAGSA
ncbi:MAG TPA: acyl-CoA dehydrogenase, partial [Hyphomonadaceae bacterium]|nr:acyl-CoA dehydrogenase [Hyphomonadaceae bacterium]